MISEQSIQELRDTADLVDVVKRYVPDLKKRGANWTGCCPFHDEKTGSFAVNESKGIYKCFGCSAGGNDAIRFIMDKENWDFVAAVKYLANWFNVPLVETRQDDETDDVKANRAAYLKINMWAAKQYQKALNQLALKMEFDGSPASNVIDHLVNARQFSTDSLINFQLGFAPDEFRFLTPLLVERGMFSHAADIGLVKTTNEKNFDIYRNRIIFPIHNERGEVIGFGGRKMEDNNKANPKYINSSDSLVFKKGNNLYGIYQAAAAIRKEKYAIMVEGYTDVISFHQTGMANTVCSCGTALTDGHAKLLKKYTSHVILMGDGDKAGNAANIKSIDLLVKYGFKVDVCPLPEGQDPDEFARALNYKEAEPEVEEEVEA